MADGYGEIKNSHCLEKYEKNFRGILFLKTSALILGVVR